MPLWVQSTNKIRKILIQIEKAVASSSLLLLLIIILIQIVARTLFDTGFSSLEIVARHLVLFITLMGAALVTESHSHIKIDIIPTFLSGQYKKLLSLPLLIISSAICAGFAWYSIRFWLDEWAYAPVNERWTLSLSIILPFGFSILSLHFLLLFLGGFNETEALSES